jgi:protein-S-isoprenylcysteine O-methyltransferase Ste14
MLSLLLRNLFFTILQPGLVAGFVPYLIVRNEWNTFSARSWGIQHYIALELFMTGFVIMMACILRFATEGRGTLSPLDPTRRLVAGGLYRFTRNPMYVGVLSMLVGEALFFQSVWLGVYTLAIFLAFHLFIIIHEEPRMRRNFGEAYEAYCKTVRRWI